MNKLVREHYPASRLPDDLRGTVPPESNVRVTIEAEELSAKSFAQIKSELGAARRSGRWPVTTREEALERIRALRDEWDG